MREIEIGLILSEQDDLYNKYMSLSKSALIHLMRLMEPREDKQPLRILELGGGWSTVFWSSMVRFGLLNVQVTSLEHQLSWVSLINEKIDKEHVKVSFQGLKQIADDEWERIFSRSSEAATLWGESGKAVPQAEYDNYTIHNAFYGEAHLLQLEKESLDVLIVDGPHGNGRSLAFPIFAAALKPQALILIDDFDHYPFLSDLRRIFDYEEIRREIADDKRWVIVRLKS